ncbi:MAG: HEAT repeat domain-containing protein [Myxococcales bacterium]|nr:HEAT repeat domain-containing protein [Myxococcales bacterium]
MHRWLAAAIAAAALCVTPRVVRADDATAPPPSVETLRVLLSSYDSPPKRAVWERYGPAALAPLIALYDTPGEPLFIQLRVVGAVANYPTPATRTFLLAVARQKSQPSLLVERAVRSLGRAFGEKAVDDVAAFLSHPAVHVRASAITALADIGGPKARTALQTRMPKDRDLYIERLLARSLATMAKQARE